VFERIVVGVSAAETARGAARRADDLAHRVGAELHVVTVYSERSGGHLGEPLIVSTQDPPERKRAEALVESISKGCASKTMAHALPGDPAKEILRVAKEIDADLIVVGDKGMHGVRRVLGSVASDVGHGATCDVLVVKTT
jgi:nucleotide-binding universal stress UspA family protein